MKRYSLILVTLLLVGMVLPTIPITTTNNTVENFRPEGPIHEKTLSANGDTVTVIRVSDDAFTVDGDPSTNYGDHLGGLYCGNDSFGDYARTWMKFNLSHIPINVAFTRATVNLFMEQYFNVADEPFGVYYSENDTWTEDTITWNNEPEFDSVPADVIDAPSSPNMFDFGNWYEWEITSEVVKTLNEDGMLTLILAQVDETLSTDSMSGFMSRENSISDGRNTIPNIAIEYSIPTTSGLQVDGFSESPQIDYISSTNPEFGWSIDDDDSNDFQKNYELEVWNSSSFDETQLMLGSNSETLVVHDTAGMGLSGGDTFNAPVIWRAQYKWPGTSITQSGVVDKLLFEMNALTGITTYTDLAIYIQCVDTSSYLDYDYEANYDGRTPIQVLNRSVYTATTTDGFIEFDIENTFTVRSGLSLIIEFRHTGASGTSVQGNVTFAGGSMVGDSGASAYSNPTAGSKQDTVTQGLKLELVSTEVLGDGPSTNGVPFGFESGYTLRVQYKYNQSLIPSTGLIDRILFPVDGFGDVTYENFSVYLVETPVLGSLSHTDMDSNYGGQSPSLVLERSEYIVRDLGHMLVIDVDDTFYYTGTNDLLIELQFDNLVSGDQSIRTGYDRGAYRAYNTYVEGNDTNSPDLYIDYIYDSDTVTYTGPAFVNATTYYWRVRTTDSVGIWSEWETASFKYEILTSLAAWSNLAETSSPIELGASMTVSLTVTHIAGINQVQLESEGTNHTMSNIGDIFSLTWTPGSVGDTPYTIYMETYSGMWSTTSSGFSVEDTTAPTWVSAPADKVVIFGESLSHQLIASDLSGIDSWSINDTTNFAITDGLVTNIVELALGGYYLNVTVTDNEGNSVSGTFIVAVIAPATPPTTTTPTATQPPPVGDMSLIVVGLLGVIVVLIVLMFMQNRKIAAVAKGG